MNISKKILIIDDDARNIFALSAILKSRQYQCVSANSASEGFAILQEDKNIGVILMDMMMPDIDGYQAITQLKQDSLLKEIPVIAVTARAMTGDKELCLKAGASGYVSKPVDIDQLVSIIKNIG